MKLEEVNQKYQEKTEGMEEMKGTEEIEEIEEMEEMEEIVQAEQEVKEGKGRKKKAAVFVTILAIIFIASAVIAIPRFLGDGQETKAADNVEGEIMPGIPEGMDEGDIAKALQQQIDESMFTMSVNTRPVFQNGNAKGKVNIINAPQNHYPCKVTLTLDEDGTVLYKNNDFLYPEQYIPEIRLSKNLKKGVYDATLTYLIYEDDGKAQVGAMSAKMQIIIQN